MGFLDKLLNKGAQALGDVVSDKLSEVVHGDNEPANKKSRLN